MVAPLIAAAGIGAVGSLLGGLFGGSAAKKAAQIQQQAAQAQIAANDRNRAELVGLSQPAIDRGNSAGATYAGLLGLGDSAASAAALDTWRGSTGYQDVLDTGLKSVTSNAYARGMGDSGATLKALQTRGANIANQNQQQYMGNLGALIATGNSAIGNVAGVSTAATGANNQALQVGSDAVSNAALVQGAGLQDAIKNLTNLGMNFASSYRQQSGNVGGYPVGTPPIYGGNLGGIY